MTGTFQGTINYNQPLGVVGEVAFGGPQRAAPWNLYSNGQAQVIGYGFTVTNGGDPDPTAGSPNAGQAIVGGTGIFAGILIAPKEYASFGASGAPLGATLTLPDYATGELLTMGFISVALSTANNNVGNRVYMDTTTGQLGSQAPQANGTGSIATTTLTITAVAANTALFAVGQRITGPNIAPDTYITAILTGTGGIGTYTVSQSQTAASAAVTADGVAPAGKLLLPNTTVYRYDSSVAASDNAHCNAIIQLTN